MTPGTFPPDEKYEPSIATNNTMSTSETPRTDAEAFTMIRTSLNYDRPEESEPVVDADFARQLERELASALSAVTSLAKERNEVRSELAAAKVHVDDAFALASELGQSDFDSKPPVVFIREYITAARALLDKTARNGGSMTNAMLAEARGITGAELSEPAPASPDGLREAAIAALSQGRSLSLYSQKAELILTAHRPLRRGREV